MNAVILFLLFWGLIMFITVVGLYIREKEYQAKQAKKQAEEDRRHRELIETLKKERDKE